MLEPFASPFCRARRGPEHRTLVTLLDYLPTNRTNPHPRPHARHRHAQRQKKDRRAHAKIACSDMRTQAQTGLVNKHTYANINRRAYKHKQAHANINKIIQTRTRAYKQAQTRACQHQQAHTKHEIRNTRMPTSNKRIQTHSRA